MSNIIQSERRIAFRKNVHMVGMICGNDLEWPFASQNLSVGGISIKVGKADQFSENSVVTLRMPSLNFEAAAWVTWKEPVGKNTALLGMKFLRFGPMADGHLPVVPRPYEAYEVVELASR